MDAVADPSGILRTLQERSAELRTRAEALQRELAAIEVAVTAPDRSVTVTVGAGGVLRGIAVDPRGARATPARWSQAVMRAYAQACREVGERAAALVQQHSPGSPAVQLMRDAIPPDPDADPEVSR